MPTYLKYEFIFFSLISIYGRIRIHIFFQPDPDPHFFPAGSGSVEKNVGSSSMFSSPPPFRLFFPYSMKLRRARQHPKSLYPVFFNKNFLLFPFFHFVKFAKKQSILNIIYPCKFFKKEVFARLKSGSVLEFFVLKTRSSIFQQNGSVMN